ncbi:hypothetical protein HBB16_17620 [Pseudonocardia sp. MCCB 268]|nr:hypothetical protein [Pseudonocardia cytotoxica]
MLGEEPRSRTVGRVRDGPQQADRDGLHACLGERPRMVSTAAVELADHPPSAPIRSAISKVSRRGM